MSLFINTNIWSLNAQRALALSQADLTRSLERLSTTLRINRASDDPVGNAVVERYTAQINGIDQARRNISHGTIFTQHADSNLESVNDQLQAIRTKIVASNGAMDPLALAALQDEIKVALAEVERLVQSTEFDGRKILNGTSTNTIFQVGPNAADTVGIATGDFRADSLGLYRLKGNPTGHSNHSVRGDGTGELLTLKGLNTRVVLIGATGSKSSAYEIAAAVNGVKEATGISASARTDIEVTGFTKAGQYTFSIESKNIGDTTAIVTANVVAAPDGTVTGAAAFGGLIDLINAKKNTTGVEASLNGEGDGIILTNAEGYHINLVFSAATENLQFKEPTLSRATSTGPYVDTLGTIAAGQTVIRGFTGQVTFDSQRPFSVLSDGLGGTAATAYPTAGLSLSPPTVSGPTSEQSAALVSLLDIDVTGNTAVNQILSAQKAGTALPVNLGIPKSTVVPAGAIPVVSESWVLQGAIREAFAVIDYAMAAVATQQAALGSAQNRLGAITQNLDSDFVNLNLARGYIQDADIALETSIQTRASIQQQVNIAILGQANALQQAVLALLR